MKKFLSTFFVLSTVILLTSCFWNSWNSNQTSTSEIIISQNNIQIWEIPMDQWKKEIVFEFTNTWDQPITLSNAQTSCMCTEWFISNLDGTNPSGTFWMPWHWLSSNMSRVIQPWETQKLVAIFDPNAHWPNATWPISRDVFVSTSSANTPTLNFKFYGNVVKTASVKTQDDGNIFSFEKTSHDFWVIKQSGWIVSQEFPFTYQWTEKIQITWVPTSCACTSATIDTTELSPWDQWVLTVKFNPNLHAEPKGKFFKTVSILTSPDVWEMPEVKIWAEIDLDLWPEAFELKSDHNDEDEEQEEWMSAYNSITPAEFEKMNASKDFVLIDTHIPEQEHLEWTDIFIPYNEIEDNLEKLPKNKDEKIVLYCRSGTMSRAAAYTLVELGYTQVYDLVWGKIAYDEYKK